MRFVAFCDVLGFSNAVQDRFEETILIYTEFMELMRNWPMPEKAEVSIYSDSILVVADDLPSVLQAVKNLWFATLCQDWMIRGGIAYGRYWEHRENGHLFVVSDALVRAVKIESEVGYPAVAFSPEIELGLQYWVPRFERGALAAPVLSFNGLTFVNPFNPFWFASAGMRAGQLLARFPDHEKKYSWFLKLCEAIERDELLVPEPTMAELLRLGILERRDSPPPLASKVDVA